MWSHRVVSTSYRSPSPDMMTTASNCDRSASLTSSRAWFCRSAKHKHTQKYKCVSMQVCLSCLRLTWQWNLSCQLPSCSEVINRYHGGVAGCRCFMCVNERSAYTYTQIRTSDVGHEKRDTKMSGNSRFLVVLTFNLPSVPKLKYHCGRESWYLVLN